MIARSFATPVGRLLATLALALGLLAVAWQAAAARAVDEAPPATTAIAHDDDDDDDEDERDDEDDDEDDADGRGGGEGRRRGPPEPSAPPPPVVAPAPSTPPAPVPTAPAPPIAARHLVRPALLTPVRGRVLGGLQPTLRWRHDGRGVRLYNVQVFNKGRKVLSIFPRGRSSKVPARRLAPGRRYVWRVWPYRERGGFTPAPLAVSWFATPPRRLLP